MKVEGRVFAGLGAFLLVTGVIYLIISGEYTGATLLLVTSGLGGVIGYYLLFTAHRLDDLRPEDRLDAEIEDGAGELGFFPPHSANASESDLRLTPGGQMGGALAEALAWKQELENVKRENEVLRRKVRELERVVKEVRGQEPEGWAGGSVKGMAATQGRSRSSSMSFRERGRREKPAGHGPGVEEKVQEEEKGGDEKEKKREKQAAKVV